jgi:hypothetical protein
MQHLVAICSVVGESSSVSYAVMVASSGTVAVASSSCTACNSYICEYEWSCPPGHACSTGLGANMLCGAGSFSVAGSEVCTACPAGQCRKTFSSRFALLVLGVKNLKAHAMTQGASKKAVMAVVHVLPVEPLKGGTRILHCSGSPPFLVCTHADAAPQVRTAKRPDSPRLVHALLAHTARQRV